MYTQEEKGGEGLFMKMQRWMRFYLTFILPVLFLIVFLMGII